MEDKTETMAEEVSQYEESSPVSEVASAPSEVVATKRVRKSIQRLSEVYDKAFESSKSRKAVKVEGEGVMLGEIERVKDAFHRGKVDKEMARNLHLLCYRSVGEAGKRNGEIRKYNGWIRGDGAVDEETTKRVALAGRMRIETLRMLCDLVGVATTGRPKSEVCAGLVEWLREPRESGNLLFRTQALRAKRRGKVDKKKAGEKRKKAQAGGDKEGDSEGEAEAVAKVAKTPRKRAARKEGEEAGEAVAKVAKTPRKKAARKEGGAKVTRKAGKENGDAAQAEEASSLSSLESDVPQGDAAPRVQDEHEDAEDDEELLEATVRRVLGGADLQRTTLNQVCQQVCALLPSVDLAARRPHLKAIVRKVIDAPSL